MKKFFSVMLAFAMLLGLAFPLSVSAISENEAKVAEFLKNELKLNTAGMCGVLANIYWESGFDPHVVGDNGTSYGICQWHNSRWDNMKTFCNSNGYDWKELEGQLWFLKYELENSGAGILAYIKGVENTPQGAYDAGYYWCYNFERPADTQNMSVKRGNLAKNTYWTLYSNSYDTVFQGIYRFKNKATGTYMCVSGGIDKNGQNIELSEKTDTTAVFTVKCVFGTVYSITAECSKSNRMVNIYADTVAPGKNVTIYDKTDDNSQQWFFQKVSAGYVIRSAADSTLVLDADGTNIVVNTYTANYDQVWIPENITGYTVSYDANGGEGAPSSQHKTHGKNIILSNTVPHKEDYRFKGWALTPDAEEAQYVAGADFSENGDITLYAVWELRPCEGSDGTGHRWQFNGIDTVKIPTCTERGTGSYTCEKCSVTMELPLMDADLKTEWSDVPLEKMPEDCLRTKTQYRYATGNTTTELREKGSGTTMYAEFPEGYNTSHIFYTRYNVKISDSETETEARKYYGADTVTGYIYWHWCSSSYTNTTPGNLLINTEKTDGSDGKRAYDTFHAFYSSKYYEYDPVKDGTMVVNAEACPCTYWWQKPIPVYSAAYKDYDKVTVAEFGEWQDDASRAEKGEAYETRTLYCYDFSPMGHKYDYSEIQPTCTEAGILTGICVRCGDKKAEAGKPPAGHTYAETVVSPSCLEGGYTVHECTVCHDKYTDSETAPLDHELKFSSATVPPTCVSRAKGVYSCTRCDYYEEKVLNDSDTLTEWSEQQSLPAEYSDFAEHKTVYRYVEDGALPVSEWQDEELPEKEGCSVETKTLVRYNLDAAGHNYAEIVTPPTCMENGFSVYECSRCGDKYDGETLPALGHTFERGHCIRCPEKDPDYLMPGDINFDGKLNVSDGLAMRRLIVSPVSDEKVKAAADMNSDGKINASDSFLLRKAIAGTLK